MQTARQYSPDERWIRNLAAVGNAGDGHISAIAPKSRQAVVLPGYVYDFLGFCGEFRPLQAHLRSYATHVQVEHEQMRDLQSWFPRLIESGLLLGERSFLEQLRNGGGDPAGHCQIAGIAIPTGNRPDRLERVAGSFLRNAAKYGHRHRCVVADNSSDTEALAANAGVLQRLGSELPHSILHLDRAALEELAVTLARAAGCPEGVVRFGLLGTHEVSFSCGGNRNAGMLLFAGHCYLSADDDVSCDLLRPEEAGDGGVLLFSRRDAVSRRFFESRDELLRRAVLEDCDFFSALGETVGRSLSQCLQDHNAAMGSVGMDFLQQLQRDKDPRISAVFPGHIGDPGIPTSCYYLGFAGENLRNLTASEEFYETAMRSRAIHSVVPQLSIGDLSLTPGMAFGLDATALVPPFFPVLHAEDFSWGAALARCCKGALGCHLPVTLRHDSGPGKTIVTPRDLEAMSPGVVFEFAHLLRHLILTWAPRVGRDAREERMRDLGQHLCGIGSLSAEEFEEAMKVQVLNLQAGMAGYYDELLREEYTAPDFWRDDVYRYMDWQRRGLEQPDFDVPVDLRVQAAPEQARGLMQRLLTAYGELLQAWPDIFAAARNLPGLGK